MHLATFLNLLTIDRGKDSLRASQSYCNLVYNFLDYSKVQTGHCYIPPPPLSFLFGLLMQLANSIAIRNCNLSALQVATNCQEEEEREKETGGWTQLGRKSDSINECTLCWENSFKGISPGCPPTLSPSVFWLN